MDRKDSLLPRVSQEVTLLPELLQTLVPLFYCYMWKKHIKCHPGMWIQECPGQVISTANDIVKYLKLA